MQNNLLTDFKPELVIFDKDGTLIDFHAMWGGWMFDLADKLDAASGRAVRDHLFHIYGYDSGGTRTRPDGLLGYTPMAVLRSLAGQALQEAGCSIEQVEPALQTAWHLPDPVRLAHPLADLRVLFETLHGMDAFVAIATGDDRAPTKATLATFGITELVDDMACGDDGIPTKPAPDAVLALCGRLGVQPKRAVMVGDTVADLQMGRAARAGLVLGVTSGVSSEAHLAPYADHILGSIADLL